MRTVHAEVLDSPMTVADDESVLISWLGQAGFLIESAHVRLAIDPYLSDSLARKYAGKELPHTRMMPVPVAPEELIGLDYVFCSHGHTDHMDGETLEVLARVNPDCRFVVPASQTRLAEERGVPAAQTMSTDAGETIGLNEYFSVTAIASAHEEVETNGAGQQVYLGYILRLEGMALYHSGDCTPYEGLSGALKGADIDVALLPVNGRDTLRRERNVLGNFSAEEALDLCGAAGIPLMIPHHFGMFEFNTVDEGQLEKAIGQCVEGRSIIPRVGKEILITVVKGENNVPI